MEAFLVGAIKGLFLVVAVIMTFFILLQEGKGGGLASLDGTMAPEIIGVANPIRRATVILAILFFVMAALLGILAC
jgi:protein translocase SecG subunit